jgi:hypothetical protein
MPSLNYNDRCQTKILVKIFSLSVLFLNLKFCKNFVFSLSEHCEWGTWSLGNSINGLGVNVEKKIVDYVIYCFFKLYIECLWKVGVSQFS